MHELEVLLVSHGRPEWLKRALESVRRELAAAKLAANIHVLINGPDAVTSGELSALAKSTDFANGLAYYELGETLGPAAARNFLAEKAKAKWLLFLDDDCALAENFFITWQKIQRETPDAEIVGGPNINPPGASGFERASGRVLASAFASMRSAWRYRETTMHFRCTDVELTSTHLFVRADVLSAFSYPETFQTAEENAFLQTVKDRFKNIYYFGELFVYHERRKTWLAFAWQIFRYGRGRGQMVRDGFMFEWFHIAPAVFVAIFVGALFWPSDFLRYFVVGATSLYAVAVIVATVPTRTLWAPLLFFTVHSAYVCGWWWGFLFRSSPKTLRASA